MILKRIALLAVLFAGGTAYAQTPPPALSGTISPVEAIAGAAASRGIGKTGRFGMLVRATGISKGHVFLNSEADYHDPKNLSIDIDPLAAKRLERQLGSPPDQYYKGKWIVVHGTARRVLIVFNDDHGRPLGKGYYQTHVPVRLPSQITVVR